MKWVPCSPWKLNDHGEWIRQFVCEWQSRYCGRIEQRRSYKWKVLHV